MPITSTHCDLSLDPTAATAKVDSLGDDARSVCTIGDDESAQLIVGADTLTNGV